MVMKTRASKKTAKNEAPRRRTNSAMALYKTTTLTPQDLKTGGIFRDLIEKKPFVLLVVLGSWDEIVRDADLLAGGKEHDSWRRVVWAQNPEEVRAILCDLDNTRTLGLRSLQEPGVVAFSVSLGDRVRDVVHSSELQSFPKSRLLLAFIKAEANP